MRKRTLRKNIYPSDYPKYIKTNIEGLVRDRDTNAVLNISRVEQKLHKENRDTDKRINEMESEIEQLKMMVKELLKGQI